MLLLLKVIVLKIVELIEEDFVNYKKPCMTVMFPYCTFKCNTEAGKIVCHNTQLADSALVNITSDEIIEKYKANPISAALVMQGLEPFDSFPELLSLVIAFSEATNDDIVIYTGYEVDEVLEQVNDLARAINGNRLIIKFGRFKPNCSSKYDELLGVTLASDNQYSLEIKSGQGPL